MKKLLPIIVGLPVSSSLDNVQYALQQLRERYEHSEICLLVPDHTTSLIGKEQLQIECLRVMNVGVLFDLDDETNAQLIEAYILRHAHILLVAQAGVEATPLQKRLFLGEVGHLHTGASVEDSLIPVVPVLQDKLSLTCWNLDSKWWLDQDKKAWPDSLKHLDTIDDFNEISEKKTSSNDWKDSRKYFHFSKDEITQEDKASKETATLAKRPELGDSEEKAVNRLADCFASANVLADKSHVNSFRDFIILSVVAGITMLCFVYNDRAPNPSSIWNVVFLIGAVCTWRLSRFFGHKKEHLLHLQYRSLAEGIRIQTAWFLAGLQSCVIDFYPAKQQKELGWIIEALRGLHAIQPIQDKFSILNSERVEFVRYAWVDDQKKYLDGKINGGWMVNGYKPLIKGYRKKVLYYSRFSKYAMGVGITLATYLALTDIKLESLPEYIQGWASYFFQFVPPEVIKLSFMPEWLLAMLIVFPIAASLLVSRYYGSMQVDSELDWYIASHGFYERVNKQLKNYNESDKELAAALHLRLGKAILCEHAEWVDMHKKKDLFESVETKD